jgi:hypothetical protein
MSHDSEEGLARTYAWIETQAQHAVAAQLKV